MLQVLKGLYPPQYSSSPNFGEDLGFLERNDRGSIMLGLFDFLATDLLLPLTLRTFKSPLLCEFI
jgi:hypothetical protein